MKSFIQIENQFSIIFDAPEILTADFLINIIKENIIFINYKKLPKIEIKTVKKYKNNSSSFGSGQISYNDLKQPKINFLQGFENPKYYLKKSNIKYFKSAYQINL